MMFFVTLLVYALQESSKNPQTEPHAVVEAKLFVPQFCVRQISRCTQAHKLNAFGPDGAPEEARTNSPEKSVKLFFHVSPRCTRPGLFSPKLPSAAARVCNFRKLEKNRVQPRAYFRGESV